MGAMSAQAGSLARFRVWATSGGAERQSARTGDRRRIGHPVGWIWRKLAGGGGCAKDFPTQVFVTWPKDCRVARVLCR
ncbi:MAG: hypothetical protein C0426_04695 [Rhodobacter sp.]|nr:hypothetical protein [Rhodobacter sp.]